MSCGGRLPISNWLKVVNRSPALSLNLCLGRSQAAVCHEGFYHVTPAPKQAATLSKTIVLAQRTTTSLRRATYTRPNIAGRMQF